MKRLPAITLGLNLLWMVSASWGQEDFEVGVDPTTNHLTIRYDHDQYPLELPPSGEPRLPGFAQDDPGFFSVDPNGVIPGVFELLNPRADINMRVVGSSSPEMKVWNPLAPGVLQIIGDHLWDIGTPEFDIHPWWHIDTSDPHYSPAHSPWSITFQLQDNAGYHLPSDPVTVQFTPEPTAVALLAAGAALLRRPRGSAGRIFANTWN